MKSLASESLSGTGCMDNALDIKTTPTPATYSREISDFHGTPALFLQLLYDLYSHKYSVIAVISSS